MEVYRLKMICAVFLLAFFVRTDGQLCELNRNCERCIANGCGWCKDREIGSVPRCFNNTGSKPACTDLRLPGKSTVKVRKAKKKSIVSPAKVTVNLEHGSPVKVPFDIQIPGDAVRKNKLLVKYKDMPSLNLTLDPGMPSGFSRKFKKMTHVIVMKNVKPNSRITRMFNIGSVDCGTADGKMKVIVRFMQKGQKAMKHKLKLVVKKKDCPCGCPIQYQEPLSIKCSGHGTWGCGKCTCNKGYHGKICEISADISSDLDQQCIPPGSTIMCSGRGVCVVGLCKCNPRYKGRFCQCDDYSCPYVNNMLCGGNGRCTCGQCICQKGYTGEACDCPTSVDSCMASNLEICNRRGTCECGVCRCQGYFSGPTCEECPTCPGVCYHLKSCAQCVAFGTGPLSREECEQRCKGNSVQVVDEIRENGPICQFRDDDDDCLFMFSYSPVGMAPNGGRLTYVKGVKVCPQP